MNMLNPMPSKELKSLRGLKKKDRETSAFKAFARALGPRASSSRPLALLVHKTLLHLLQHLEAISNLRKPS